MDFGCQLHTSKAHSYRRKEMHPYRNVACLFIIIARIVIFYFCEEAKRKRRMFQLSHQEQNVPETLCSISLVPQLCALVPRG